MREAMVVAILAFVVGLTVAGSSYVIAGAVIADANDRLATQEAKTEHARESVRLARVEVEDLERRTADLELVVDQLQAAAATNQLVCPLPTSSGFAVETFTVNINGKDHAAARCAWPAAK